jgi:hypothetical protein
VKNIRESTALSSVLAIAGALAFCGQAQADTLEQATLGGINFPADTRTHTLRTSALSGVTGYGGLAEGTETFSQTFLNGPDGNWLGWCLEPQEYEESGSGLLYALNTLEQAPVQGSGSTMEGLADVGSLTRADAMRRLVGGGYSYESNTFKNVTVDGLTDQDLYTAFQLAVWEVANETSATLNVNSASSEKGSFYLTSGGGTNSASVISQANAWLGGLDTYTPESGLYAFVRNAGGNYGQDFMVKVVPIPAAAWLFGSALFGTAALGRRKRKEDKLTA